MTNQNDDPKNGLIVLFLDDIYKIQNLGFFKEWMTIFQIKFKNSIWSIQDSGRILEYLIV